mgnify:CR=1 FL=1
MTRVELVVFDWDGTLMDSAARIVEAVNAAVAASGLPPRSEDAIRGIIGLGMHEAIEALYPDAGGHAHQRLAAAYRDAFVRAVAERPASLFPGVEGVLGELEAGRRMLAIATGKSRTGLARDLERSGVGHRFVASRTVDESPSKPEPQMLEEVMALCGVGPEATVLVGDTLFDMEMAARAGVPAVAVAWGVHEAARLRPAAPLGVLDRIEQLPQCLHAHEAAPASAADTRATESD